MKNKLKIFMVVALIATGVLLINHTSKYKMTCEVIRGENGVTIFEDNAGNLWEIDGVELQVGDMYKVTFKSKSTDRYYTDDQKIIDYRIVNH